MERHTAGGRKTELARACHEEAAAWSDALDRRISAGLWSAMAISNEDAATQEKVSEKPPEKQELTG